MENVFIGKQPHDIVDDTKDELVSSVISLIRASNNDPNRSDKKDNIEECVKLKRGFHSLLPDGRRPMMKSSLYAIMSRKIRVSGVRNPRIDTVGQRIEDQVAIKKLQSGLKDVNFPKLHKDIYKKYDKEGSAFVFIMEGEDGKVKKHLIPYTDFFYDPNKTEIEDEWDGLNDSNIRWCCFRRILKRATFNKEFPEWQDKVASGTLLQSKESQQTLTEEGEEFESWDLDKDVEMFYFFSIINSSPVFMVLAGSSATKILLREGSDYQFRTPDGAPYLPVNVFNFSTELLGLVSASAMDFVKDGAEALKRNFNHALSNAGRIINAPVYMFGSADENDIKEQVEYYEMDEAGYAPLIQRSSKDVSIQSLAPQDISVVFRNIKGEVLDDLSERVGFMLRKLENAPRQRVGVFVRQDRDEGDAIQAIDRRNEDVFLRFAKMVYWTKCRMPSSKMEFNFGNNGKNSIELDAKEVKNILKGYMPEFIVDTDMDNKLTFQEKIQSKDLISNDLIQLYNLQMVDEVVAEAVAKTKYSKAVMLGFGRDYTLDDFMEAAKADPPPNQEQVLPEEFSLGDASLLTPSSDQVGN